MAYSIEITPNAGRQLRKLPANVRNSLAVAVDSLADNPHPTGAAKITGVEHCWRIRVGDFRIVYQVRNKDLLVLVVRLGDRKEVYKDMVALRKALASWESSRK